MAQLKDKLMNRTIEGKLSLDSGDQVSNVVNPLIESAIEADKDILSKLNYVYNAEEGITTIDFPSGIQPITIYFNTLGESYFFDYGTEQVFNEDGDLISDALMTSSGGYCSLVLPFEVQKNEEDDMTYIRFNYGYAVINTFNLSSNFRGGTKLYVHNVNTYDEDSGQEFSMTFISPFSKSIKTHLGEFVDYMYLSIFLSINETNEGYAVFDGEISPLISEGQVNGVAIAGLSNESNIDYASYSIKAESIQEDEVTPL